MTLILDWIALVVCTNILQINPLGSMTIFGEGKRRKKMSFLSFPHAKTKNIPSVHSEMSMRNMKCQFENQGERWTKIKHRSSAGFWLCLLWAVSSTPGKSHIRVYMNRHLVFKMSKLQVTTMASLTHPKSTVLLSYEKRPEKGFLIWLHPALTLSAFQLYETSLEFWTF